MLQSFGRVVAEGSTFSLALAARAYAGQRQPKTIGELLPATFRIEFHTGQEFLKAGAPLPGSKPPAAPWGHVMPHGVLWVNSDEPAPRQIYALRHEPFHPLISANMTASKRKLLLPLVERVKSKNPYRNRLDEVLCDAFVELFWGRGSILDNYYGDIADEDLQKAFDILMKPVQNEPVIPVEPPQPLPLPDDPAADIADLQDQIDTLTGQLSEAEAKIDAAKAALG